MGIAMVCKGLWGLYRPVTPYLGQKIAGDLPGEFYR
jgi:hypothetical protein